MIVYEKYKQEPEKLFLDEIKISLTQEDLEKECVKYPEPKFDRYYIRCAVDKDIREYFESMYCRTKLFLDENFVKESQKDFHQRSWEMYIVDLMMKKKPDRLIKPNKEGDADVKVIIDKNKTLHIECVAPEKGELGNKKSVKNHEYELHVPELFDPERKKYIIRMCNSLLNKFEQFQKRLLKGRVLRQDQYIIAFNMDLEYTSTFNAETILSYFSADGYVINKISKEGDESIIFKKNIKWDKNIIQNPIIIKGDNGDIDTHIPLIFMNTKIGAGISGVIFYFYKIINNVTEEKDLFLIHNPDAQNPIDKEGFDFMHQYFLSRTK